MLTNERIHEIAGPADYYDRVVFARAIEAEVRKEQAEKIAELTRQLAEARKDSERYRWLRFSLSDRVSGKSHWFCSIPEGQPDALDKEIDAAIKAKEQQ